MLDSRAQALVFDVDGTLVDTMPLHLQAWMQAARSFGFPFDEADFYRSAGKPAVEILSDIKRVHCLSFDVATVVAQKERWFEELIPMVRPIPVVVDVVRASYGLLPMALGTGGCRRLAQASLDAAGLSKFFSIMVAAEDVRHHKPAPDTFLECARQLNVEPAVCQVFEDAELGLEAARRAGMIPCDIRPYVVAGGSTRT